MLNIKDEDFDNLIKKSVQGQDIRFEPAHWEKMEQKLERHEAKKAYNRTIRNSALILSFLWSIVMLWLYVHDTNAFNENDHSDALVANNEKQVDVKGDSGFSRGEKPVPISAIPRIPGQGKRQGVQPGPVTSPGAVKPQAAKRIKPEAFSGNPDQRASKRIENGRGMSFGNANAPVPAISGGDQAPSRIMNGLRTVIRPLEMMPADLALAPYVFESNISFTGKKHRMVKKVEGGEDKNRLSGLYVSLNAAANLSSVGFSKMAPPGFDGGVTVEYFMGEKVSVVTGALYSTKKYTMDEGYQPGNYNVYYSETIERVDGNCAVLDIPLNLRYYFISSKKHLFFLSSGISSYLMLHEAYDIYYAGDYGSETKRTKKLSNENKHIFGIVNFSFGYERVLTERFSLQVAPFVKVPVTDIGDGKVGLTSAGAFFSLKYRMR